MFVTYLKLIQRHVPNYFAKAVRPNHDVVCVSNKVGLFRVIVLLKSVNITIFRNITVFSNYINVAASYNCSSNRSDFHRNIYKL